MGSLIGISDIGPWMSKKYIDRYGFNTKWAKQFVGKSVIISTNRGLWREGAQGYTGNPADAGKFDLETAWDCIKELGPEKYAKLCLNQPVRVKGKQHVYLTEVKATLEIVAASPEEAANIVAMLAAPLEVFPGCVIQSVPKLEDDSHGT